jgi:hypothetical protein
VQVPPQQSEGDAHVSPFCWQYDGEAQRPLEAQKVEQQSDPCMHGLPLVLHEALSAVQVPAALQRPLQHCTLVVHACESGVQAGNAHAPAVQVPLQQSDACRQPPPRLRHVLPASGWNAPPSGITPLLPPPDEPLAPLDPLLAEPLLDPGASPFASAPELDAPELLLAPPLVDPPLLEVVASAPELDEPPLLINEPEFDAAAPLAVPPLPLPVPLLEAETSAPLVPSGIASPRSSMAPLLPHPRIPIVVATSAARLKAQFTMTIWFSQLGFILTIGHLSDHAGHLRTQEGMAPIMLGPPTYPSAQSAIAV